MEKPMDEAGSYANLLGDGQSTLAVSECTCRAASAPPYQHEHTCQVWAEWKENIKATDQAMLEPVAELARQWGHPLKARRKGKLKGGLDPSPQQNSEGAEP